MGRQFVLEVGLKSKRGRSVARGKRQVKEKDLGLFFKKKRLGDVS